MKPILERKGLYTGVFSLSPGSWIRERTPSSFVSIRHYKEGPKGPFVVLFVHCT